MVYGENRFAPRTGKPLRRAEAGRRVGFSCPAVRQAKICERVICK